MGQELVLVTPTLLRRWHSSALQWEPDFQPFQKGWRAWPKGVGQTLRSPGKALL